MSDRDWNADPPKNYHEQEEYEEHLRRTESPNDRKMRAAVAWVDGEIEKAKREHRIAENKRRLRK